MKVARTKLEVKQLSNAQIGKGLKNLRKFCSITQAEVGELLNLGKSSINDIEKDKKAIKAHDLVNLLNVFYGIDYNYFIQVFCDDNYKAPDKKKSRKKGTKC